MSGLKERRVSDLKTPAAPESDNSNCQESPRKIRQRREVRCCIDHSIFTDAITRSSQRLAVPLQRKSARPRKGLNDTTQKGKTDGREVQQFSLPAAKKARRPNETCPTRQVPGGPQTLPTESSAHRRKR